jgi:hypothetical protein
MKKIISLVFIILIVKSKSNAQNVSFTEMVGKPTNSSATIQLFFSDSAEMSVQYGTVSGTYPNQTQWSSFSANLPAEITINGLQADTKYYYRVRHRVPGTTTATTRAEHFFHTQRNPGSTFSFVVEADPKINTAEKAIEHVKNGGDLQKVPAEFMHIAIEANSSSAVVDTTKRFKKISPNGGAIGVTRIYHLRESDGKAGNQGWVFKAAKPYDNVGELVGWNYLAAVGILEDGAIQDGKLEMDVRKPGGTIKKGTPYIIIPLAHNDVPQGAKISPAAGAYDFVARDLNALPDKAFPERFGNLLANFVLGVSDRHAGNGMGRVVEMQDGKKLAHVVPLDLG